MPSSPSLLPSQALLQSGSAATTIGTRQSAEFLIAAILQCIFMMVCILSPVNIVNWQGSYEIFVPYKDYQARVVINPIRPVIFDAHKRLFLDKRGEAAAPIEGKVGLNRRFFRQFGALWAIIVNLS